VTLNVSVGVGFLATVCACCRWLRVRAHRNDGATGCGGRTSIWHHSLWSRVAPTSGQVTPRPGGLMPNRHQPVIGDAQTRRLKAARQPRDSGSPSLGLSGARSGLTNSGGWVDRFRFGQLLLGAVEPPTPLLVGLTRTRCQPVSELLGIAWRNVAFGRQCCDHPHVVTPTW